MLYHGVILWYIIFTLVHNSNTMVYHGIIIVLPWLTMVQHFIPWCDCVVHIFTMVHHIYTMVYHGTITVHHGTTCYTMVWFCGTLFLPWYIIITMVHSGDTMVYHGTVMVYQGTTCYTMVWFCGTLFLPRYIIITMVHSVIPRYTMIDTIIVLPWSMVHHI